MFKCIAREYLDFDFSIENGKKDSIRINQGLRKYFDDNSLGKFSTKNNKHLIKFISNKSPKIKRFLESKIRVGTKETWLDFFDLLATLRHVVAHNEMNLNNDSINHLKSKCPNIYNKYFLENKGSKQLSYLTVKESGHNLILQWSAEFGLNMAKFIKDESNLSFAGFY